MNWSDDKVYTQKSPECDNYNFSNGDLNAMNTLLDDISKQ